jgi:dihydroxy-acid dehydratase
MASMAEALGMTLPGNAAIPAPDSRRLAMAELAGRRAVEMAKAGGPKPSELLTAPAFDNAIRALMAIGGSTNAVIHLLALVSRCRWHASTSSRAPRRSCSMCARPAST